MAKKTLAITLVAGGALTLGGLFATNAMLMNDSFSFMFQVPVIGDLLLNIGMMLAYAPDAVAS